MEEETGWKEITWTASSKWKHELDQCDALTTQYYDGRTSDGYTDLIRGATNVADDDPTAANNGGTITIDDDTIANHDGGATCHDGECLRVKLFLELKGKVRAKPG